MGKGVDGERHERIEVVIAGQSFRGGSIFVPRDVHALRFGAALSGGAQQTVWRAFKAQVAHRLVVDGGRRGHEGERIDLQCELIALCSQGSGEHDGRVSTDLEPHRRTSGEVLDIEVHMEGAMMERIGDFEAERPGELLQVFGEVFDGEGHAVGAMLHDMPFALAHNAMFGQVIFSAFVAECAVPRAAHEGEKDGGVATPEGFVAMPNNGSPTVDDGECVHLCT